MIKIKTSDLYGKRDEVEIKDGNYQEYFTCLFPFAKESNILKRVMTAKDVAIFVNAKIENNFGFCYVKGNGTIVHWYDDQPYNIEAVFKLVNK